MPPLPSSPVCVHLGGGGVRGQLQSSNSSFLNISNKMCVFGVGAGMWLEKMCLGNHRCEAWCDSLKVQKLQIESCFSQYRSGQSFICRHKQCLYFICSTDGSSTQKNDGFIDWPDLHSPPLTSFYHSLVSLHLCFPLIFSFLSLTLIYMRHKRNMHYTLSLIRISAVISKCIEYFF